MRTVIGISVNNGKQVGSFSIEFKSQAEAFQALTNAMPNLTRKGVFTAEQLCFDLLINGIAVEQTENAR